MSSYPVTGIGAPNALPVLVSATPQPTFASFALTTPEANFSANGNEVMSWDKDGNWNKLSYPFINLLELFFQGKSLLEDKGEYLDLILKLPEVKGSNLKAVEYYERFARLMAAWELMANGELK